MFSDIPQSVRTTDNKNKIPSGVAMLPQKSRELCRIQGLSLLPQCRHEGTGGDPFRYARSFLGDTFPFPQFDDIHRHEWGKTISIETLHFTKTAPLFHTTDRKDRYFHEGIRMS